MNTLRIKQATAKGFEECCENGVFNWEFPESATRRGRVIEGGAMVTTLTATGASLNMKLDKMKEGKRPEGKGWVFNPQNNKWFRIRKLTPKECFRLMGVPEDKIEKMLNSGVSDSQLYKCAGNSIVCNVMAEAIFKPLFHSSDNSDLLF